jgi:trehalose/maltose hydrolase-like predicted phosphorylase/beta-phosphoglucomutase-like phosphatase (HAD superfamily)
LKDGAKMAFQGAIFDVDGVLVDSPHELAWREALRELMEGDWRDIRDRTTYAPERFTPAVYQQVMAGMPRMAGARAALEHYGVPDVEARIERYAAGKQEHVFKLIEAGQFTAFPDALRFILAVKAAGVPVAVASSSKNAELFLRQIRLDTFAAEQRLDYDFIRPGLVLLDLFDANVAGRDFPRGKPDPAIFLSAAKELGVRPGTCFVVEDATTGVTAAKAGKMAALGVARLDDRQMLTEAGADLVVTTLDDVSLDGLKEGRLRERRVVAERRRRRSERPKSVWSLQYDGFDARRQGLREALCTLGNGYFATRGALAEASADSANYPGTYVAGLYNRLATEIAGRSVENEDLVNVPNWLPFAFRVEDGPWFDVLGADVLDHRIELDLAQGMLIRQLHWQDPAGRRTTMVQRRVVSMKDPHLAALEATFTAENWSGRLEIRSGLDGNVVNAGVKRYRDLNGRHLDVLQAREVDAETLELVAETNQSHIRVALAARTRVLAPDDPVAAVERRVVAESGGVAHALSIALEQGHSAAVQKVVALYTSRDRSISESSLAARLAVKNAPAFEELRARHALAWSSLWNRFDIQLDDGNEWTELVLHLHEFHLLQTVSPNTIGLDVGVPARGWHGEAYRGHVFWDEMFIFPFLNFQRPILAEVLLGYRHDRLDAARAAAHAAGYEGAMFPWQSGSDGREETQQVHLNPKSGRWLPDHSHLQRHVNIAIAYNVWQHYMVTGNVTFLRFVGAELLIEIARLLASLATFNANLERYEILGVMGPDEYHEAYPDSDTPGVNNNTYTNVMTAWVMLRALEALDVLPEHYRNELIADLNIAPHEIERWRDIGAKMRVVFHADGVLTQFEGYEALREFDWTGYRARYGDVQRLDRVLEAENDSPNNYKLSKQADVLMLLFVLTRGELLELLGRLGYDVTQQQLDATIGYYLARTAHGSTLSGVVSTWVLARSDPKQAWAYLITALQSDIADVQGGTTAEGIHLGAMAGTVDIVQRRLTGMRAQGEVLRFDPALPAEVKQIHFSVHYRGHRIEIRLSGDEMRLSSRPGSAAPIKIRVRGETAELCAGDEARFDLKPAS